MVSNMTSNYTLSIPLIEFKMLNISTFCCMKEEKFVKSQRHLFWSYEVFGFEMFWKNIYRFEKSTFDRKPDIFFYIAFDVLLKKTDLRNKKIAGHKSYNRY